MNDREAESLRHFLLEHGCAEAEALVATEITDNRPAVTRWLFLQQLWPGIIDGYAASTEWIDRFITQTTADPTGSFADAGHAMKRMVAAGVPTTDIAQVMRFAAYEAVFGVLSFIDDGFVQNIEGEEVEGRGWALVETDAEGELTGRTLDGLHESLLSMDPSGREGRPK